MMVGGARTCMSESSRSHCHKAVRLLFLVWRTTAHACSFALRIPKGVGLHWRGGMAIPPHMCPDVVIPDTIPQADILATRRVVYRIVPLAGPGS